MPRRSTSNSPKSQLRSCKNARWCLRSFEPAASRSTAVGSMPFSYLLFSGQQQAADCGSFPWQLAANVSYWQVLAALSCTALSHASSCFGALVVGVCHAKASACPLALPLRKVTSFISTNHGLARHGCANRPSAAVKCMPFRRQADQHHANIGSQQAQR